MGSTRYLAAHISLPQFVRQHGAAAVLDAIGREDEVFFRPVWMEAGFRFTPDMFVVDHGDLHIGVLSLPTPQESPEAYLCAVVGHAREPQFVRCFLLEQGSGVKNEILKMLGAAPAEDAGDPTVLGEWDGSTHRNHGEGPPITGDFVGDVAAFVRAVAAACQTP
ncbi:MAG: hypothetical protein ABI867_19110 [Kofleriaceae bacterium]